MFARMEIGRIAGITIYLDMMFVLVLLFFTYPYFTAGNQRRARCQRDLAHQIPHGVACPSGNTRSRGGMRRVYLSNFFRRMPRVRSRSALSRMKPSASFWS